MDLGRVASSRQSSPYFFPVKAGNAEAVTLVRSSGTTIGKIWIGAVNSLIPELIIVGGEIGKAHEMLLASIRSVVYR